MVFGGYNNSTHYRKLDFNDEYEYEPFKPFLLKSLNMSDVEYKGLHKMIKDFRDKYSTHREIDYQEPVPYFDIAYKVVDIYLLWLEQHISMAVSLESMIEEYREELQKLIKCFSDC